MQRLCRSPTTISREIKLHRCFVERQEVTENDCVHYTKCLKRDICSNELGKPHCTTLCKFCISLDCTKNCKSYASRHCKKLNKPPYVCNGCEKQHSCKLIHAYYSANRAHDAYKRELKESRSGIRTTVEDLERIDDLISSLIKKGQSINHIFASHAVEIGVSEKTLYTYINDNVFLIRNMDLPKKVKYKARRKKTSVLTRIEYKFRRGRTLEDFQTFTQVNPALPIVEMDTVKGPIIVKEKGSQNVKNNIVKTGDSLFDKKYITYSDCNESYVASILNPGVTSALARLDEYAGSKNKLYVYLNNHDILIGLYNNCDLFENTPKKMESKGSSIRLSPQIQSWSL